MRFALFRRIHSPFTALPYPGVRNSLTPAERSPSLNLRRQGSYAELDSRNYRQLTEPLELQTIDRIN